MMRPFQPDVRDVDDVTLTRECLRRFGMGPERLAELVERRILEVAPEIAAEWAGRILDTPPGEGGSTMRDSA